MWREERGVWINSHPSPSFSPILGWEFTLMGKLMRQEFFVYTGPRILNKHTRIHHLSPPSMLINRDKMGKFPECWVEVFCFLFLYFPHPIKKGNYSKFPLFFLPLFHPPPPPPTLSKITLTKQGLSDFHDGFWFTHIYHFTFLFSHLLYVLKCGHFSTVKILTSIIDM